MNSSYQIVRIQRYLKGELSSHEMYDLEREALDDPLLQDAIDGYRLHKDVSHRQLSLLQQRLADRIEGQAKARNAFFFGWQRLSVAATACVLMVLVLVLLWMRNQPASQTGEKEVLVELVAPESLVRAHAVAAAGSGLDAYPEGGWDQFNAYLTDKLAGIPLTGAITLTFDITAQGVPMNIQAADVADTALLNGVLQALAAGPRWTGSKGQVEITFE